MKRNIEKVMPNGIEMFWSVPSFVDGEGNERVFSYYFVHSVTGDIWSCRSNRYLVPSVATGGYMYVGLLDDSGKQLTTGQHRFVLASSLGAWEFEETGHKDRVRYNNKPNNLFPTTRKEQFDNELREAARDSKIGKRSNSAEFSDDEVRGIRNEYKSWVGKSRLYIREVAARTGVTEQTIYCIVDGRTYKDII
ncbi:hypothetical protein H1230_13305 [Paenibacillus sp. 19GGS1-52]|uniref:hypothetical protein n=1 Tax=Paenibacillus sp. 19GGS1-52 TaxID=2758563 RepID=UPI001EFB7C7B|nr:hypothetical protein [Paenibacillus sp. 19GGS1-52]ULO09658.1 hypothetical protein H1230_13305 [Paenibacillus sp. 19GGS1-52]